MTGMIVDDGRAPLPWIPFEFGMIAVKAVKLDDMARAALLVRNFVEIDVRSLMLLMTGRAGKATRCNAIRWKR